jgi:hypothetical protein
MGMADKTLLRAELRVVRIHPQTKIGQVQPTVGKLNPQG